MGRGDNYEEYGMLGAAADKQCCEMTALDNDKCELAGELPRTGDNISKQVMSLLLTPDVGQMHLFTNTLPDFSIFLASTKRHTSA